jgi:hypothetical protein
MQIRLNFGVAESAPTALIWVYRLSRRGILNSVGFIELQAGR